MRDRLRNSIVDVGVVAVLIGLSLVASGCIGGERSAYTDIWIGAFDANGTRLWDTTIDSGKNDYATALSVTADGGYILAGWIADDQRKNTTPRFIRLNSAGDVLWDATLGSHSDTAAAIVQTNDGGFFAALHSGIIHHLDDTGSPVWNKTIGYTINSMITTTDGGFACAGSHTFGLDGNGTILWDQPSSSTSILQAADGGFIVEESSARSAYGAVFRLDANGTVVWTHTVGSREYGRITSLYEKPDGSIEAVYTFHDPSKDKDLVQYMESEAITLGMNGTVTDRMPSMAVDPLIHVSDGGYAFSAFSFPGSAAFTSFPHGNNVLHMVRLAPDGTILWDKPLELGQWIAPESVMGTRDGGFVALVVLGS